MTWNMKQNRDREKLIDLEDYLAAREKLIYSRITHLDQLSSKLKEKRVHSVIAPMLEGVSQYQMNPDDVEYVVDLGLLSRAQNGALTIANRIYQEVIPRELSWGCQMTIEHKQAWYLDADNRIDMPKLLAAFQQFFRENAEIWLERFDYKEAAPQLLMQAFLQRIINGGGRRGTQASAHSLRTPEMSTWTCDGSATGTFKTPPQEPLPYYNAGRINREYALGRKRTDLIIFNRDSKVSWDDKVWQRQLPFESRDIGVWGC